MHPQLEAIATDFETARTRVKALDGRLTPDAWRRRPSAEQWSPAECIAHLNLTAEAMLPRMRAALEQARRLGPAPQRYRRDLMGWLIWKSQTPGSRIKIKTQPSFVPFRDRLPAEVIASFDRLHTDLIDVTRECDGVPIDRVMIASPFNEKVRYNLYAALSITATHDFRHLRQAERAARA
ncbi:MAG TPA: DinB family protein [Vicinamibacterales bacterium]